MVVGDVAGSGLDSAVLMGLMRSALRSYALEFGDTADVLAKLDRKMQYFEDEVMAGWFAAAGLTIDQVQHLKGGELTVTLWRGTKAAQPQRRAA